MKWQVDRAGFFEEERRSIRRTFPDVKFLEMRGCICLKGLFPVYDNTGNLIDRYELGVWLPPNYPEKVPRVIALDKRIEATVERHVFPKNRTACLCLPHEVSKLLPEVTFMQFWEKLLRYWLLGQAYFDRHGEWPFDARPHNFTAIYESFSEMLEIENNEVVKRFVALLLRKNPAKGHELCPCGSGKKLRSCHQSLYRKIRNTLSDDVIDYYRKCLPLK